MSKSIIPDSAAIVSTAFRTSTTASLDDSDPSPSLTLGIIILLGFVGVIVCMCLVNLIIYFCLGGSQIKDSPLIYSCSFVCWTGCFTQCLVDLKNLPSHLRDEALEAAAFIKDKAVKAEQYIKAKLETFLESIADTLTPVGDRWCENTIPQSADEENQLAKPSLVNVPSNTNTTTTEQNCGEVTHKDREAQVHLRDLLPPKRRESQHSMASQTRTTPLSPSSDSDSSNSDPMDDFNLFSPTAENAAEDRLLSPIAEDSAEEQLLRESAHIIPDDDTARSQFGFSGDEQDNPHVH